MGFGALGLPVAGFNLLLACCLRVVELFFVGGGVLVGLRANMFGAATGPIVVK